MIHGNSAISHGVIQRLLVAALLLIRSLITHAAEPTAGDLEFFEEKIRPIFVEHCYECHGETETNGGLRLDVAGGWLTGGDSGPAVIPANADDSLLVQAIRYGGIIEMPPSGKLPEEKIRRIEQWVARGAPAPQGMTAADPKPATMDLAAAREFWAYRPVAAPAIPETSDEASAPTAIDRFIMAKLDNAGLNPQAEAEPTVLVRRLYFDLVGLPPTPADIDGFLNDPSPSAYTELADRLLASPQFGQRWGRHWLDVVRFAESLTLRGFVLPEAWRYRDYVIESFRDDVPYDEFVKQQIAGDLLPADSVEARQRQLIATTFLALGNTNLEEQDKRQLDMDVVDEQLDVIGKAILGQTIGCARCHDHKFDPIPTRDYYALAGIFRNSQALEHANVSKWIEVPLPLPESEERRWQALDESVKTLERQIAEMRQELNRLEELHGGAQSGPAVLSPTDLPGIVIDDREAKRVGEWMHSQHSRRYIGDGYVHDLDRDKGKKTLTFAPELPRDGRYEVRLAYTPGANRSARAPVTVFSADGETTIDVDMRPTPPLEGRWISLGQYQCEAAGQNFVLVATENTEGHVVADAVQYIPVQDSISDEPSTEVADASTQETSHELARWRDKLRRLERKLDRERKSLAKRPMVMSVVEREEITDSPIHVRGSVHTLGEVVPRGFLQVVSTDSPPLPSNQSGRRELAEWIASRENSLTARVMANRVWYWLMGEGLVRTMDNFGSTGEPPSHPELLDHLAARFVDGGWSVKRLVRYIVLSAAYRRTSQDCQLGMKLDPENRLFWRANRRRLDAECLRDAMLRVAGRLDLNSGGRTLPQGIAADFGYVDRGARRSVYVPVLRNAIPALFEVFDFPDPSMVVGRRNRSTTATQALFLMNSPFVREQAEAAARRMLAERPANDQGAINLAYRQTIGRRPTPTEFRLAEQVLAGEDSPERAWTELYHILFSTLDFRYRD